MSNDNKTVRYDLSERTACFGEQSLQFLKKIKRNPINDPMLTQLAKAATSVGANYCEAEDAVSKKDFRHRISICRKEAKEAMHWFRMLGSSNQEVKEEARVLWREAKELNLIFAKIFRSCKED